MGARRVQPLVGQHTMSYLAEVRALFLRVRLVGHAAGRAGLMACPAKREILAAMDRAAACGGRQLCRGVVERALRGTSRMCGLAAIRPGAASIALDGRQ